MISAAIVKSATGAESSASAPEPVIVTLPVSIPAVAGSNAAVPLPSNSVASLLSLRAVDADVLAWYRVLLAQGVVILVTTIPLTPGNVGIAEIGYTGVLVAIAGRNEADAIAAGVVLSRIVTWLMTDPIGWITALRWQSNVGKDGGPTAQPAPPSGM